MPNFTRSLWIGQINLAYNVMSKIALNVGHEKYSYFTSDRFGCFSSCKCLLRAGQIKEFQDSLDHCPMPINTDQSQKKLNADQSR